MKKTKKVLAITIVLMLILGCISLTNAFEFSNKDKLTDGVTIVEREREKNVLTYKFNLPSDTYLRGDVNDDGVVDDKDEDMLTKYNAQSVTIDKINAVASDYNGDNTISISDVVALGQAIKESATLTDEGLNILLNNQTYTAEQIKNLNVNLDAVAAQTPIRLIGTLADKSKAVLKKKDGKFYAEVTLPENTNDGTIGIVLVPGVFINKDKKVNKFVSSGVKKYSALTISNGIKEGNKVTFKISSPKKIVLKGDVNSDCKIDESDLVLLGDYLVKRVDADKIDALASDVILDDVLNVFDKTALRGMINDPTKRGIALEGDLADKSSFELKKNSDGSYSVVVTLPEDATTGKVKVVIKDTTFNFEDLSENHYATSPEFDLSKPSDNNQTEELKVIEQKDEKQSDGKIKVTVIVNKELDKDKLPNGWTISEDGKSITKSMNKDEKEEIELVAKDGSKVKYTVIAGAKLNNDETKKDDTTAPTNHPQTGASNVMLFVIAGIALFSIVILKKYKNNKIK